MTITAQPERWAPLYVSSDYAVSDHGRIKSIAREVIRSNNKSPVQITERLLTLQPSTRGYKQIVIRLNGSCKLVLVHRAVAMAFCSGFGPKLQVNHLDGDKTNNHWTNLEWCSCQENLIHSSEVLGLRRGECNHQAKLSEQQVREIQQYLSTGLSQSKTAKIFGVSTAVVNRIHLKKTWRHVV